MSTPKGFSSQEKDDRLRAEFATIEPVRTLQHALSVLSHSYVYEVGTDTSEALSSTIEIVATAHAAQKGDVIRITSGALSGKEAKVFAVSANGITLSETLPSALGAGVTFQILRHKYPLVNSDGTLPIAITPSPIQFNLDGAPVEVTEDTAVPANNIPLPVKLTSVTGDINITAGDLNVQLSHVGADYDSTRIGDGTELLSITASGQAEVAVTAALPAGTNNIGDVDVVSSALPTGASTEAKQDSQITELQAIKTAVEIIDNAIAGNEMQVDVVSSALPAGAATEATLSAVNGKLNSLGQKAMAASVPVVIASDQSALTVGLPTGAATEAKQDSAITELQAIKASVQILDNAIAGNEMQVDVLTLPSLPSGTNSIGRVTLNQLDTIDFLDVGVLDTSVTPIPASSSTPLTVVANLVQIVSKMQFMDTTGEYIGVYSNPAVTPVLECIIGPGSDSTIDVGLPANTVLGLRNMANATITSGKIAINFIG